MKLSSPSARDGLGPVRQVIAVPNELPCMALSTEKCVLVVGRKVPEGASRATGNIWNSL